MTRKSDRNKASAPEANQLSRRQQQVMDIIFAQAPVTARNVWELIANQPAYASVRTTLRSLVDSGHITYVVENKAFVYSPVGTERAAASALGRLVATFYDGSVASTVSGLLGMKGDDLDREELEEISKLLENYKKLNDEHDEH